MTKRKFERLPRATALRRLLQTTLAAQRPSTETQPPAANDELYLLIEAAANRQDMAELRTLIAPILADGGSGSVDRAALNELSHALRRQLGTEALEWDLAPPDPRAGDKRGPLQALPEGCAAEVFLHKVRSPFNVGSMFRTADAAGFRRVLLHPECPAPGSGRLDRSAMGATDWVPWSVLRGEELFAYASQEELEPICLETGGTSIWESEMPDRMLLIVGSEELGVPDEILERTRRLSIPMFGRKASLNVGVSFGIAASWWAQARTSGR